MRSVWSIAFTCEFHNSWRGFTLFVADCILVGFASYPINTRIVPNTSYPI